MIVSFLNSYFIQPLASLMVKELLLILGFALIFDFFWQYLVKVLVVLGWQTKAALADLIIKRYQKKLVKLETKIKQLEAQLKVSYGRNWQRLVKKLARLRKKHFGYKNFLWQATKPFEPFVSIIVPCHNAEAVLENTLKQLLKIDYENKEIIVVDDGSTDKTAAIAAQFQPQINLVQRKVCSGRKTGAINFGLAFCRGDIVVVVDDDTLIAPSSLRYLVQPLKEAGVAAVGGNVKVYPTNGLITKVQEVEYLTIMQISKPFQTYFYGTVLIISGAFGAFYKKYLAQIGQWDVDIVTEDLDVTWKLYRLRKKVAYSPQAVCWTEIPTTIRQLVKQRSRWDYGLFETVAKHKKMLFSRRFPAIGFGLLPETVFFELFSIFVRPLYIALLIATGRNLYTVILTIFYFYLALEVLTIFTAGLLSGQKSSCFKFVYAPLMLLYHQFLAVLRFRALWRFITKKGVEW